MTTTNYVFDQSWHKERDRLGAIESLFDGSSRRLLTGLGVGEGWRCLEVGCGAGGLALWLADMVGETGRVLATDLDTRFLDGHGRANLDVRTHNIVTDPVEEAGFDLIHARAVLEHLPDRQQVVKRLVAALRPGGWIMIEDTDFGGPTAAVLARYLSAAPAREVTERIYLAVAALFVRKGAEASYGNTLPGVLADAGLTSVAAEVHTPVVTGGSEQWARGTVEQLAPALVGTGLVTDADIERFLAVTADPDVFYVCPLMVSAWGQRPL
jgi:2-polyprenyl-3-methyl-5-hydroxy-6-metoxy-1,4-benzoquinol methylase